MAGIAALLGAAVLLVGVVGRASEHLRVYLFDRAGDAALAAALLQLVSAWILCLAVLAIALAWRATAWTVEAGRPRVAREATVSARPEEARIA